MRKSTLCAIAAVGLAIGAATPGLSAPVLTNTAAVKSAASNDVVMVGGGGFAAGLFGGLVGGAIVGAAVARPYYYYPPPYYYRSAAAGTVARSSGAPADVGGRLKTVGEDRLHGASMRARRSSAPCRM